MKKAFLFLFTISLIFNSCSSDNNDNEEFDIVGTWEETNIKRDVSLSHEEYHDVLMNSVLGTGHAEYKTTLILKKDKTFTSTTKFSNNKEETEVGTYSFNSKNILIMNYIHDDLNDNHEDRAEIIITDNNTFSVSGDYADKINENTDAYIYDTPKDFVVNKFITTITYKRKK